MISLVDYLHCARCKGRLNTITADAMTGAQAGSLFCPQCELLVPVLDGIPDFIGARALADNDPAGLSTNGVAPNDGTPPLLECIRLAAVDRWPASLGDVLALGSGDGLVMESLAGQEAISTLLVVDSNADALRACRERLGVRGPGQKRHVGFARLSMAEDVLRDARLDLVIVTEALSRVGDVHGLLTMIHRVLRAGGQAILIAPNRRYRLAMCHAIAEVLVLQRARQQSWPEPSRAVIRMIAAMHQRYVHHSDPIGLAAFDDKHVFHPEVLEDLAQAVGFAQAEARPLQPDRLGGETTLRLCRAAGVEDAFAAELAPLVMSVGAPLFSLLGVPDSSAAMLLWLTKGIGPSARIFAARPAGPVLPFRQPEAALGGLPPRWSIEATAQETADGLQLTVDG